MAIFTIGKKQKKTFKVASISLACFFFFLLFWSFVAFWNFRAFYPHALNFFGFPGSNRNYLIVFQDNNELRPTGGSIPFYGILKFRHGFFAGLTINSSKGAIAASSAELLPSPAFPDGAVDGLYSFKDANIDPSFPESAEHLEYFFKKTFPSLNLDGVIAADFTALEDILSLAKSVKVEGVNVSVQDFFPWIEQKMLLEQKNVDQTAAGKFIKRLAWKNFAFFWNYQKLSTTLEENFNEKHLMAYMKNPLLAQTMEDLQWSGKVSFPGKSDFIGWNMVNTSRLPEDRYLSRRANYTIDISQNPDTTFQAIATLDVRLFYVGNGSQPSDKQYRGVIRTFIPMESQIMIKNADREDTYNGAHVFSKEINLDPGQAATVRYRYVLPAYVLENNTYALALIKQPGVEDKIAVTVKAPKEFLVSAEDFQVKEHVALYEGTLKRDRTLRFALKNNPYPPLLTEKFFDGQNKLVLSFNRDVDAEDATDGLNFSIADKNTVIPYLTDRVVVQEISYEGDRIVLDLEGLSEQPGEEYEVTIKHLRDRNGTLIDPDPMTFSIAQHSEPGENIGGPE